MATQFVFNTLQNEEAQQQLKNTFRDFFRYFPEEVCLIEVAGNRLERGGEKTKPIKIIPAQPTNIGDALAVKIFTKGAQCFVGSVRVSGWSAANLRRVIEAGPYNIRNATKPTVMEEVVTLPDTIPGVVVESTVLTITPSDAPEQPIALHEVSKSVAERRALSAKERLEKANFGTEETRRLRETLASIMSREMKMLGLTDFPNTLQVPVKRITEAIMEHMKLPSNAAGNYRGTIASFYVSRISLFALKSEYSDAGALYTDWLFDGLLVRDFIGDQNQMEALSRAREREIAELKQQREKMLEDSPPSARVLEEAVRGRATSETSILNLAAKTMEARRKAEEELSLATDNEKSSAQVIIGLRMQLAQAEADLAEAKELVRQAEEKVKGLTISEETMQQLRQIKAMITSLAEVLNI